MAISAINFISYLQSQSTLTALLNGGIWLDLAADGAQQPYLTVSTPTAQPSPYFTSGHYVRKLRLDVTVYAPTLATVDTITAALLGVLGVNVGLSPTAFGCLLLSDPIPKAELGGAYSSKTSWTVWEDA